MKFTPTHVLILVAMLLAAALGAGAMGQDALATGFGLTGALGLVLAVAVAIRGNGGGKPPDTLAVLSVAVGFGLLALTACGAPKRPAADPRVTQVLGATSTGYLELDGQRQEELRTQGGDCMAVRARIAIHRSRRDTVVGALGAFYAGACTSGGWKTFGREALAIAVEVLPKVVGGAAGGILEALGRMALAALPEVEASGDCKVFADLRAAIARQDADVDGEVDSGICHAEGGR